ncbi:MAG: hypothetical protein DIU62_004555 [Pseudomonadota bacterium]|nr:MAG: hypothetical protein DIU62_06995 [Pseudomonadota bacterium]
MTRTALLLMLAAPAALAGQPDACAAYQMDVSAEVDLFQEQALEVPAGDRAETAPQIEAGRLYQVKLRPQRGLTYPVTAARREPDAAQSGGMVRVFIAEAGRYRVSVDQPSWVDAIHEGRPLESLDFRSSRECSGPTKIVTFHVPAGAELLLQFIDVDRPSLRLAVTPVPPEVW